MEYKSIQLGTACSDERKYLDGQFRLRVPVLEGEPEAVAAAEALRLAHLNQTAVELYDYYTNNCSMKQLDALFERARVKNLRELMRKAVTDRNYYLLSLISAEQILKAERSGLLK